jgi:hypothetical protein
MADAMAAMRDVMAGPELAVPLSIVTDPQKPNDRQPYLFFHDWEWAEDRDLVLRQMLQARRFDLDLRLSGAAHGRQIDLSFDDDSKVRIVLDQGFGPWRSPPFARFDFAQDVDSQSSKIDKANMMIAARGPTYIVVTHS